MLGHRLRLRLRSAAGALIVGLTLLAATAPGAQAFNKAVWGDVYVNGVNQFPMYHQLGASIYEIALHWNQVAPTRPADASDPKDPAYQWPLEIQQAVTQARRFHMRVMIQIIGAPPWSNGGHPWNWAPRPGAYATFAATAARRYPSVHLWMIWGEPDRKTNFEPETTVVPGNNLNAAEKVAPHNYARILDAAYGSLKHLSTANLVIGGSTFAGGDIDTQEWIENLRLPDGRPPRMDMYAHNPFGFRVPLLSATPSVYGEVQFADLGRLAQWIDRYLHRKLPIFLSEWTLPTAPDDEFDFYVDPATQAKWITDALRVSRHWTRIYALGWIHMYDAPPYTNGGLLTAAGVRKPGFYAFEHG